MPLHTRTRLRSQHGRRGHGGSVNRWLRKRNRTEREICYAIERGERQGRHPEFRKQAGEVYPTEGDPQ